MDHPKTSLPALPVIAAAYTAGTGLVILAGWTGGVISAIGFAPQYVSAKANAAACFVLAGASLWLQTRAEPGSVWRGVARACGATVAVVGGLTLFEYLLGVDLGIDELLFRDAPPSPGVSPGRMAPAAAGSLLAMGTALVLSSAQGKRAIETAQALCVGVVLVALLGLLGYLYALPMPHGLTSYTRALPASAALMACSLGVLALHSDRGLVAVLASDSAGGAAARRLLPWVVFAPIFIGWIALAGQLAGLYDFHLATAGMVFGSVVVFSIVVWANAYTLHRFDRGRRQSEARMRSVLDAALDAAIMMDAQGLVSSWNVRAVEMFRWTREEAIGRTLADLIIPARYREAHTRGLSRFLATGEGPVIGRRIELIALRRDGTEFPIELTVTALQEPGGYVFNAFIADITARKDADRRLRESEEQYRLLFESNPYPMAVFDQETLAFLAVNDAAVRHYGYSRDEFLAMTVRDFQ